MLRPIQQEDLTGKSIKEIDCNSINYLKLTFSDNTILELYAENAVYTPCGNIPGILVEDSSLTEE